MSKETNITNVVDMLSEEELKLAYEKYQMMLLTAWAKEAANSRMRDLFEYRSEEIPKLPETIYEEIARYYLAHTNKELEKSHMDFSSIVCISKIKDTIPNFDEAYERYYDGLPFD